jgi:NitT/TauT family transport system substrate-binding protein
MRRAFLSTCVIASLGISLGSQALAQATVRYSEVGRSVLFAPSYIADAKGFFKDEGLKVDFSTANGSDKATAAILTNNADIALVGPETAVFIQNGQSPTKIKIFCGLTATGGDFLLSRTPMPGFKWSSLKGKQVLSWREGSAPDLILQSALRKNGLDPQKDVTLIRNVGNAARLGAFLSGTGDVGVFYEPDPSRVVKEGQGFVLGSVGAEVGPIEYTVFVATTEFLKDPRLAQGWTNAIYRAQKWLTTADANEAAKLLVPYFPGMDADILAEAVKRQRENHIWKVKPTVEAEGMQKVQSLLIDGGLLKDSERVDYNTVVAPQFAADAIEKIK